MNRLILVRKTFLVEVSLKMRIKERERGGGLACV